MVSSASVEMNFENNVGMCGALPFCLSRAGAESTEKKRIALSGSNVVAPNVGGGGFCDATPPVCGGSGGDGDSFALNKSNGTDGSVSSCAVSTPPIVTDVNAFNFSFSPPTDPETNVSRLLWGLGIVKGADDAVSFREVEEVRSSPGGAGAGAGSYHLQFNESFTSLALVAGRRYYVTVRSENGAGPTLLTDISSDVIIVDPSPPRLVDMKANVECEDLGEGTFNAASPGPEDLVRLWQGLEGVDSMSDDNISAPTAATVNDADDWGLELCWQFEDNESWVTDYAYAIFTSSSSSSRASRSTSTSSTAGESSSPSADDPVVKLGTVDTVNALAWFTSGRTTRQLSHWTSLGLGLNVRVTQDDLVSYTRDEAVDEDAGLTPGGYVSVHLRVTNAGGLVTQVAGPEIYLPPPVEPSKASLGDQPFFVYLPAAFIAFLATVVVLRRISWGGDRTRAEKEREELLVDGTRQVNLVLSALAPDFDLSRSNVGGVPR